MIIKVIVESTGEEVFERVVSEVGTGYSIYYSGRLFNVIRLGNPKEDPLKVYCVELYTSSEKLGDYIRSPEEDLF
jgi:hypothetical protein